MASPDPQPSRAPATVQRATSSGAESASRQQDPLYYNYWHKILSRPVTRVKARALLREVLAGVTVSLAQVPEAVAFSFTAGVDPIIGLQAAWMMGVVTALFGGAPGMVSGATGALAVVLPDFVAEYGVGYLFVAVIMMGVMQLVFGLLGGGKLIKLVGHPVMLGFCNGLAIVIGIAQLHSFQLIRFCSVDCDAPTWDWDSTCAQMEGGRGNATLPFKCERYTTGATAGFQALEVLATMAVIVFLPRLTRAFPSSLAGIVMGTVIEFAVVRPAGFETPTVGDLASVKGFFPLPIWADSRYSGVVPSLLEAETYRVCLPIAVTMAIIGLVESLMTLQLVGQITNKRPSPRAEALAQGAANVIVGAFGGMGGCAMIGQSLINVSSGGITRISTTVAGVFLLLILLVAYPLINLVPMASLAGVMFMVVIGTFEWHSLPIILASLLPERVRAHPRLGWARKVKRSDVFIVVLVTVVAVVTNLAYAVGAGVALAALVFAWDQADLLRVDEVGIEDARDDAESETAPLRPSKAAPATDDSFSVAGSESTAGGTVTPPVSRTPPLPPSKALEVELGGSLKGSSAGRAGSSGSATAALAAAAAAAGFSSELATLADDGGVPSLDPKDVRIYRIKGALFFASAQRLPTLFHPHHDPPTVVLYLDETVLSDYSALVAINAVAKKYAAADRTLLLRKMTTHALRALRKAGHLVYTFDRSRSAGVNAFDLLSMTLEPSWERIRGYPDQDSVDDAIHECEDPDDGTDAAMQPPVVPSSALENV